jgi:hypothetical protein
MSRVAAIKENIAANNIGSGGGDGSTTLVASKNLRCCWQLLLVD